MQQANMELGGEMFVPPTIAHAQFAVQVASAKRGGMTAHVLPDCCLLISAFLRTVACNCEHAPCDPFSWDSYH